MGNINSNSNYGGGRRIGYVEAMEDRIMAELEKRGYEPDMCRWGIRVSMGADTWIVDVRDAGGDGMAVITLHHRNNIDKPKSANYMIPGYHKQLTGRFTATHIADVMEEHGNKWLSEGSRRDRRKPRGRAA